MITVLALHRLRLGPHTRVVSTANWARNKGKPSTTTPSLRSSMMSRTKLVLTRLASRQMRAAAFSNGNPSTAQHPRHRTPRPVVAKKAATPARVNSEGERQTETPKEQQSENLLHTRDIVVRHADGAEASSPSCDRRNSFLWVRKTIQNTVKTLQLDISRCFRLPPIPWLVRVFAVGWVYSGQVFSLHTLLDGCDFVGTQKSFWGIQKFFWGYKMFFGIQKKVLDIFGGQRGPHQLFHCS